MRRYVKASSTKNILHLAHPPKIKRKIKSQVFFSLIFYLNCNVKESKKKTGRKIYILTFNKRYNLLNKICNGLHLNLNLYYIKINP